MNGEHLLRCARADEHFEVGGKEIGPVTAVSGSSHCSRTSRDVLQRLRRFDWLVFFGLRIGLLAFLGGLSFAFSVPPSFLGRLGFLS